MECTPIVAHWVVRAYSCSVSWPVCLFTAGLTFLSTESANLISEVLYLSPKNRLQARVAELFQESLVHTAFAYYDYAPVSSGWFIGASMKEALFPPMQSRNC